MTRNSSACTPGLCAWQLGNRYQRMEYCSNNHEPGLPFCGDCIHHLTELIRDGAVNL